MINWIKSILGLDRQSDEIETVNAELLEDYYDHRFEPQPPQGRRKRSRPKLVG